jgi:glycerophosphoryl diester phosphodiesterase
LKRGRSFSLPLFIWFFDRNCFYFLPKEHDNMSNTQGGNTLTELFSTHPITNAFAGLCAGPILIGHRGASLEYPENTIPAFARALQLGAKMLELDVRLSKDGQVVVIHDPTVDRTTNGSGPVQAFTLAQLKALKCKLPADSVSSAAAKSNPGAVATQSSPSTDIVTATLEEVFQAFPQAIIAVEIKDESWSLCLKVVELIKRYDRLERTTIVMISINAKLANALRKLEPRLTTGHTTAEIIRFVALSKLRAARVFKARGATFEVPIKRGKIQIVTTAFIRAAHKKGIRIFVWTINDPAMIAKLYKMGVDGIFTDNLALARKTIEKLQSQNK